MKIPVLRNILEANDAIARQNQDHLAQHGILALNLLSSPGSGKTSLLEQTADVLAGEIPIAVIEGDIAGSFDAERLERHGVPVVQINTDGGCHLTAGMVQAALENFDLDTVQIVFIENVGNLVCPANFEVGEDKKVVLLSTPEGEDKPLKYPTAFTLASAVVVNKIDLVPYLGVDMDKIRAGVRALNPAAPLFEVSCRTGEGIQDWVMWLRNEVKAKQEQAGVG